MPCRCQLGGMSRRFSCFLVRDFYCAFRYDGARIRFLDTGLVTALFISGRGRYILLVYRIDFVWGMVGFVFNGVQRFCRNGASEGFFRGLAGDAPCVVYSSVGGSTWQRRLFFGYVGTVFLYCFLRRFYAGFWGHAGFMPVGD